MGKQLVAFQVRALRVRAPCSYSRLMLPCMPCCRVLLLLCTRTSQAAFEMIAARFPDAFSGYTLSVTESHQSSKARAGRCLCCNHTRAKLFSTSVPSPRTLPLCTCHQVDTSGTAKALVASFQKLGPRFELEDILKVRDAPHQREMGVPGACVRPARGCLLLAAARDARTARGRRRRGAPERPRVPHLQADVARRLGGL
jgi:hypothetical protein